MASRRRERAPRTGGSSLFSATVRGGRRTSSVNGQFQVSPHAELKGSVACSTLEGKARRLPISFPFDIDADVGVAELRQRLRGLVRIQARRAGAVHDDRCGFVRQQSRCKFARAIVGEKLRTGEVAVSVVLLGQCLEQSEGCADFESSFEFVAGDGVHGLAFPQLYVWVWLELACWVDCVRIKRPEG